MKYRVVYFALGLVMLGTVSTAQALVTAKGQARGSTASLLGNIVGLLDGTNTGPQTTVEPGNFSVALPAESALDVLGLVKVISGASSTIGTANGLNSSVTSIVGETTADVLNHTLDVLESSALADVDCNGITANATVRLAEAGDAIDVPLNPQPNTTINVAGLLSITLNRQAITIDPITRSIEARVDAVVIQVLSGADVLEVILSTAFARLENLPANCPVIDGPGGPPPGGSSNLTTSRKTATFISDGLNPGFADPGDVLRFNVQASNTGAATTSGVVIVDRLPRFATLNPSSVRLDGVSINPTIANCLASPSFNGCGGETASDTTRQCLSFNIGDLTAGETNLLTFEATVSQNVGSSVCNTARVANQEVTVIVAARGLTTTGGGHGGGGGCALNPSAASGEAWPVFLVALLWMLHRRRRMVIQ